jgi:hypothetical protein
MKLRSLEEARKKDQHGSTAVFDLLASEFLFSSPLRRAYGRYFRWKPVRIGEIEVETVRNSGNTLQGKLAKLATNSRASLVCLSTSPCLICIGPNNFSRAERAAALRHRFN